MFKPKVNFNVVAVMAGKHVIIRDMANTNNACMSVTNAAEFVVATMLRNGTLQPDERLYYYDTAGALDEIVHEDGEFVRFKSGGPE